MFKFTKVHRGIEHYASTPLSTGSARRAYIRRLADTGTSPENKNRRSNERIIIHRGIEQYPVTSTGQGTY